MINLDNIGEIHEKDTLLLRTDTGEANGIDGKKYKLSLVYGHTPCVQSLTTEKFYTIKSSGNCLRN